MPKRLGRNNIEKVGWNQARDQPRHGKPSRLDRRAPGVIKSEHWQLRVIRVIRVIRRDCVDCRALVPCNEHCWCFWSHDAGQPMWIRTLHETLPPSLPPNWWRTCNLYCARVLYKTRIYTEIEGVCTTLSRWLELFRHGSWLPISQGWNLNISRGGSCWQV